MKLNAIAPINSLGYGVAATNLLVHLQRLKVGISLFPIAMDYQAYSPLVQTEIQLLNVDGMYNKYDPCLKIWHQNHLAEHIGKAQHIGFPFFELDTFNPLEKNHLQNQDLILTTSKWGQEVIKQNNIYTTTKVVPLGVDRQIFYEGENKSKTTRFLNVGKWEIRKGHDLLIEAFGRAFTKDDDVELYLACSNPFLTEPEYNAWMNRLNNCPLRGKIILVNRFQTFEQVANLMRHADVGVFPSHAEGWNLELLEMMSCGKTVIATNYSAHTEFCDNKNCMLIEPTGMEKAIDGKWFHGQGNWCKFDIDELIGHMRLCHAQKECGTLLPNDNGIETAKRFSWGASAQATISAIWGGQPAPTVV